MAKAMSSHAPQTMTCCTLIIITLPAYGRRCVLLLQVQTDEVFQRVVQIVKGKRQNYYLNDGENAQTEILSVYEVGREYLPDGVVEVEN